MEIIERYCPKTERPWGVRGSVHSGKRDRFDKAIEQAEQEPIKIEEIIKYTNEYLQLLGMDKVDNPILTKELLNSKNLYKKIKEENGLEDERDIIWMKFTEDGYLGVVATSNDINFQIPNSSSEYNEKRNRYKYKYNTSGIIVHSLNKKWNENFVLVFPLNKIPDGLKRGDIERGVGDYLIKNGVPILDYYSHRY